MMDSVNKAKLVWQCRRGMLELDLILNRFLEDHLESLDEKRLHAFSRLLHYSDPELYACLMGHEPIKDEELVDIVKFITAHDTSR